MEINRNNYEAYLLDYVEKTLSAEQVAELMIFLEANPDLKFELDELSLPSVQANTEVVYQDKQSLKKSELHDYSSITADNYPEYFVASLDGELSDEDEKDLEIFLGLNPQLKNEYDLYRLTVLSPDTNIKYPDKSSLKKGSFGVAFVSNRRWIYTAVAVAASLAILLGVYFEYTPETTDNNMAQVQTIPENEGNIIPHHDITVPSSPGKPNSQSTPMAKPVNIERSLTDNRTLAAVITRTDRVFVKPEDNNIELIATAEVTALPLANSAPDELAGITRSYFTDLYGYIQQRQQREYLEYLAARDARPWYSKALTGVKTLVAGPDEYDPKGLRRDNDLWMLAEAGVKGINFLTKSDLKLKRQLDEDGRTSAYAVASDRFQYAGKVDK